ncbi:DUF397 domain-containing protein [Streptomyces sp. NPDC004752]
MSTALQWFKSSYSGSEGGDCVEVAHDWRKSSYSSDAGGNCIEVAHDWRKSSHSSNEGGNCIEVATHPAAIHIRDSKNDPVTGAILTVSPATWTAFLSAGVVGRS